MEVKKSNWYKVEGNASFHSHIRTSHARSCSGFPGGRLQVQFRALPCVGHLAVVASHEVDGLTKDSLTPLKESLAGKNNNNREGITVSCLVIRIFSLIQISDTICRFGA